MRNDKKTPRVILFGLAIVFLGALALAGGCKKKQLPPRPPPPAPTPVVAMGSVVYVQQGHLVRLDLETSQTLPLTSGKSTEWFPACSPDGSQVAYWSNAEDGVYNVWKINLDGTLRTRLTFDQTHTLRTGDQNLLVNTAPCWSADGKKILYASEGDIWTMDSDGYNSESVLAHHSALCPSLSPDGKTVVFISNADDTVFNLLSLNLSDKSITKLTTYTDWNVGSPSFSMDGKKIIFNLYRSSVTQVYTVDANGANPTVITTNNRSLCPRFAIRDRKMLYCSYETGEEGDLLNVFLSNLGGTEVKALTTVGGTSPSWAAAWIKPVVVLPTPIGK